MVSWSGSSVCTMISKMLYYVIRLVEELTTICIISSLADEVFYQTSQSPF